MAAQPGIKVTLKNLAFKKRVRSYVFQNLEYKDLAPFFAAAEQIFIAKTREVLQDLNNVKSNALLEAKFRRPNAAAGVSVQTDSDEGGNSAESSEYQIETFYIQSAMKVISPTTQFNNWFKKNVVDVMVARIDQLQEYGSGWTLHEIVQLEVNYNKFVRFSGTSYLPLPKSITNKHAVVNVKNDDNQCFKWAVLSALHPAKDHSDRVNNYERFKNELNFENIQFPVTLNDISVFENQNPNISINVYIIQREYDINSEAYKNMLLSIRLTEDVKSKHIHLLLIFEDNDEEFDVDLCNVNSSHIKKVMHNDMMHTHYAWIKNLSAMIQGQVTKCKRNKKYICDRCLHYFSTESRLNEHIVQCNQMNKCKITLPEEQNRWLSFSNHKNKIEVPFIIYADIESLLSTKVNDDEAECSSSAPKGAIQKHIANSIGYYFHARIEPDLSHYGKFFGPNCISDFINHLKTLMIDIVWPKLHEVKPMKLSEQEDYDFQNSIVCHICNNPFTLYSDLSDCNEQSKNENDKKKTKKIDKNMKVRDHCHMTGKFRGAAHHKCNLKYQISKNIPVVFHNLNYDSHFLIERLANIFPGKIDIIPKTSEDYISFTKEMKKSEIIDDEAEEVNENKSFRENLRLRFIDSYRFLRCSLAELAKNLLSDDLKITRKEWKHLNESEFKLLTQKGVYPYEYMDSWDKFAEMQLPSKKDFYDKLNDSKISDEQYEFAQKIWDTFKIGNMREYTHLYLKTDVLLLADIFENFRDNCIKMYEIDPAHYYTLPGYSWDCMLKHTQVQIELFTDIDKMLFVEKGVRGGISQCSKRHSVANNEYMDVDYDASKPTKYLMYFDVNNLYGWAMSQFLPISDYTWCSVEFFGNESKEIEANILKIPDNSEYGFMMEVDIEYPESLHDLHNDYPFCCEHLNVGDSTQKKLVLTLYDKQNYVIHYRMLKAAIKHGLRVKKIHKVLRFKQSAWLNDYIMLNTNQRAKSKTKFEKDLYKLMNNAIFGKTMENVRKRVDIKLISNWNGRYGLQEMIGKPNFKRCVIFNEDLAACELNRLNITINKPMLVGFSILELSKICMYEFHYDFMLKYYDANNCRIVYTDTDSFMYELTDKDIYKFIKANPERFDTSDFPLDNRYGIDQKNPKKIGIMKDENNGKIVKEIIGLRSKMYAYKMHEKSKVIKKIKGVKNEKNEIVKKAKGIKRNVLENKITFKDFKHCVEKNFILIKRQTTIRSHLHNIYTISNLKKALDPFDDKRYLIPNSCETLAWGHYKIKKQ